MTLARWLARTARAHPDRPALGIGDRTFCDYATLAATAARLAGWLAQAGARPGDRVAILSENRPEYIEALYAAWWAGCAVAPLDASLKGADLRRALETADATIAFVGSKAAADVAAVAPKGLHRLIRFGGGEYDAARRGDPAPLADPAPGDLAWLYYTSGRSGPPKGAMLSHQALGSMAIGMLAEVDALTPRDAQLLCAPLSHGAGLSVIPTVARAGVNVLPESAAFDEAEMFELAADWRRASVYVAPTMLRCMAASGADCDPTAFRTIISTGDTLYMRDVINALDRFGPRLAQIYGIGEFPMTIARLNKHDVADRAAPRWRSLLNTVGRPFLEADVTIRDDDGNEVADGEIGEVCVRGPGQMSGYWRDPEATRAALYRDWLRTGDLGRLDSQGYLKLLGPRAEIVRVGEAEIHPYEVEEALLAHPDIEQAAVVCDRSAEGDAGRTKPARAGLIAYVVGDAQTAGLVAWCRTRLSDDRVPAEFRRLDDLPRSHNGKVLRAALRDAPPSEEAPSEEAPLQRAVAAGRIGLQ